MIELRKLCLIHLAVILLVVFCVVGCEKGASSPQSAKAADSSTDVVESDTAVASPASTSYKKQRYINAIQGLSFTSDGWIDVEPFEDYDINFAQQRQEDAYDLSQAGFALDAIKAYCDAIRAAPDLTEPYNGLGLALRLQNKPNEAIAAFNSALINDPQFTDARYNLAITLWMLGERANATQQMQQVANQQSDHALAFEKLAIWHYYDTDDEAAWGYVHAALELDHEMPPQFMALLRGRTPEPSR